MTDGSFVVGASPQPSDGDFFTLNMNPETTGGLASFLVPIGTHKFQVHELPEVNFTQGGEAMVVLKCKVVESNVPDSMGTQHTERIVIPGDQRKEQEPLKWNTMMKMLRLKLEAITGQTWREDDLKFRPKDLIGCLFIATVSHEESQKDGKTYTNSRLNNWEAVHNTAQQQMAGVIGGINLTGAIPSATPDTTADVEPF